MGAENLSYPFRQFSKDNVFTVPDLVPVLQQKQLPHWQIRRKVTLRWKLIEGYFCRHCGGDARVHPATNHIWGCLNCGSSASLYWNFEQLSLG